MDILLSQINPMLRSVCLYTFSDETTRPYMAAYDHRVFYVLEGRGKLVLDGETFPIRRGALLYWMSGHAYRFLHEPGGRLTTINVNFDFLPNDQRRRIGLPIVPRSEFCYDKLVEDVYFTDATELNEAILLPDALEQEAALQRMLRDFAEMRLYYELNLRAQFLQLILSVLRAARGDASDTKADRLARELACFLRERLSQPLTNAEIGARFNYHPNYLNRLMLRATGKSLHQYLTVCRIREAIRLLLSTDLPIARIAEQSGFGSVNHFCATFKAATGQRPGEYRAHPFSEDAPRAQEVYF